MSDKQPNRVCWECGNRYCERHGSPSCITVSPGTCEVCGEEKLVGPAYDYGWLKPEWQDHRSEGQT